MGLMDFLGGAVNAGTQVAAGQQQGEQSGSMLIRQMMNQSIANDEKRAQTVLAQKHADYFGRQIEKPQLGDPNFGTVSGTAKADEMDATTPAMGRQIAALAKPKADAHSLDITTTAEPTANAHALDVTTSAQPLADAAGLKARAVMPMEKELAAYKSNQEGDKEIRVSGATVPDKVRVAQETGRIGAPDVRAFNSQNKPLVDAVKNYADAKSNFAAARNGNAAAYKSAILGFAGMADPKASLRQGVIQMVSQLDPSLQGRFRMMLNKNLDGQLPPDVLNNIDQLVDALHASHKALYAQRRAGLVSRIPQADMHVPSADELFDVPGVQGGAPPAGADPFAHIIPKKP